jgi:antitoxin (DNA-binding transcriptional repressor) of toxin-antitoxin stability system
MSVLTLAEAQARLPELVRSLTPGDELLITENSKPIAKVTAVPAEKPRPIPGRAKGMLSIISEDDEHLKDFEEYMP